MKAHLEETVETAKTVESLWLELERCQLELDKCRGRTVELEQAEALLVGENRLLEMVCERRVTALNPRRNMPAGGGDFQRFSVFDSFAGPEGRPALARRSTQSSRHLHWRGRWMGCWPGKRSVRAGHPISESRPSSATSPRTRWGTTIANWPWRTDCRRAGPRRFFLPKANVGELCRALARTAKSNSAT